MRKLLGIVVLGLAVPRLVAADANEILPKKPMKTGFITVQLTVEVKDFNAVAHLEFANHGRQAVFLEGFKAGLTRDLESNVFRIKTEGNSVRYIAKLVKRRIAPEDYRQLPPKETVKGDCNLNQAYGFLPGTHTYLARYEALHSSPEGHQLYKLQSNEVEFSLTVPEEKQTTP